MDGDVLGAVGMRGGEHGAHECTADPGAAKVRQDEAGLQIAGTPVDPAGAGDPGGQRQPGHAEQRAV